MLSVRLRPASSATSARRASAVRASQRCLFMEEVCLTEQGQGPVASVLGVEREEHDPLEPPETEGALGERHLLASRGEQRRHQPFPVALAARDDPLEQYLEILEEARLPLLYADDHERVQRMNVGDAVAPSGARNRLRDVIGDE